MPMRNSRGIRSLRTLSFLAATLQLLFHATYSFAQTPQLADYVNTLQGTNSKFELTYGNTYPAVAMPWGMNTWTPQTGNNGDGWKYQYHKDTIRGFQQSHQCSSWSNDYAVFSLMPVVGELIVNEDQRAAKFQHQNETAKPHYYAVKLETGVQVEISPSERGAFLRFSFPKEKPAFLVFDGYTGGCKLDILPEQNQIVGGVRNGRNQPRRMMNHFILECDQSFISHGTWRKLEEGEAITPDESQIWGRHVGAYLEFKPGSTVNVRVASSYINHEQAELTLKQELAEASSLEAIRETAKQAWNQTLGKVVVEGGTLEEKRTFYSCFFRASLFPRKFYEIDSAGNPHYRSPYDGRVHQGYMYTDTGLWDTFRSQMPLRCLLHPEMQGRYLQAMLAAYEQCGWLPSWSFPGEAGSMIGNHAITLFADAWAKGIRTFDPFLALSAYHHESNAKGPWGPANGRNGVQDIKKLGYLPYPKHREATAKTLEYAYDDFCGFILAQSTRHDHFAHHFGQGVFNYRNVFNPETGFMSGRNEEGEWPKDFDPAEWGGPFTEGSAWHWTWSVFHDIQGLIQLIGSEKEFVAKLDAVFSTSSDYKVGTYGAPIHEMREMVIANMGQYAHGNQPIQHMVYLYNYAGEPWKSQKRARDVMSRLYNSGTNGYPGDEDQGQTSSWYVLSALGFYSVCPGTDEYVIGSPVFEKATISLENGKSFVIDAHNNSPENVYIQSASLNDTNYTKNYLRHADIVNGGQLDFQMGPQPNQTRGVAPKDRPFSTTKRHDIQAYSNSAKSEARKPLLKQQPSKSTQ